MPRRDKKDNKWSNALYRIFVTGLVAGFVAGSAHLFVINVLKKRYSK